jgi:hypothetical protein
MIMNRFETIVGGKKATRIAVYLALESLTL